MVIHPLNFRGVAKTPPLKLTWHDVVHMYECHSVANSRYYLKSRSSIVRLVLCLLKSNKGMKDNFLIASGEWYDGLYCLTLGGEPGGVTRVRSLDMGFTSFSFVTLPPSISFPLDDGFYQSERDLLLDFFCK